VVLKSGTLKLVYGRTISTVPEELNRRAIDLVFAYLLAPTGQAVEIIYPVHLNPNVDAVARKRLIKVGDVHLLEPLD
jgi:UDP-N-acetylglucosamine 2-epimerase